MIVKGTIWGPGIHHMWLDNKPTKVHATPASVRKDYEILKENLPITLGIDHLDEQTLQKNKILNKMNLLNVGVIKDVELLNDEIKITESTITNPTVQELYDRGELPNFSIVSDMFTAQSQAEEADVTERYSVINRVDFVEKGACKKCMVDQPGNGNASTSRAHAKAIIGDDNVASDPQNPPAGGDNSGDGQDQEPTMVEIFKEIKNGNAETRRALIAIEGKLGIKEPAQPNDQNQQPPAQAGASDPEGSTEENEPEGNEPKPAGASDPNESRIKKLEDEIEAQKAAAAKAEAAGIVDGYLKEGKIKPKDVDNHIAMAMATPENYKEVMKDAPVLIDMEKHSKGAASGSDSDVTIKDEEGNEVDMVKANEEIDKEIKAEGGG